MKPIRISLLGNSSQTWRLSFSLARPGLWNAGMYLWWQATEKVCCLVALWATYLDSVSEPTVVGPNYYMLLLKMYWRPLLYFVLAPSFRQWKMCAFFYQGVASPADAEIRGLCCCGYASIAVKAEWGQMRERERARARTPVVFVFVLILALMHW